MTSDLLVFPIGSADFGIWEKDISSVTSARSLHRLPLSPKAVAGMALVEEHSATIFDLAACLGIEAGSSPEHSRLLLLKDGSSVTGYAVAGTIDTWPCPEDRLLPLPKAVRTPAVDACAVRGDTVIPIINIRKLHERLVSGILDVPVPKPAAQEHVRRTAETETLRTIRLGGETFCVAGKDVTVLDRRGKPVTGLPYASERAEGVLVHEGSVLPVIALGARLGLRDRSEGNSLLFVNIAGEQYALVVDGDLGPLDGRAGAPVPLPPIARAFGLREAIMRDGEVIPLLDLEELVASRKGDRSPEGPADAYTPASDFSRRFQSESVEIAELSLLGVHHAVPREQIKEVLPIVPFRSIPGVSEIVIGVAEREGRVFPVLDLAAIFGRRTRITERSRMLRLNNGDFHALVLVEEAGAQRVLTADMQRRLPIALPHEVLYGCYLDERVVRLILNVHALSVHFERTELRELVASLAPLPEASLTRSGEAALLREREQDERAATEEPAQQEEPASEDLLPAAGRRVSASAFSDVLRREQGGRERQQAAEAAAAEEERRQQAETEQTREQEQLKEKEAERLKEEEAARVRAEAEAAAKAEEERRIAAETAAKAEEERRMAEAKAAVKAEEERKVAEAEAAAKAEEARKIVEAEAAAKAEEERRAAEEKEREEAAALARAQAEAAARAAVEMKERAEAEQRMREEREAQEQAAAAARLREEEERKQEELRNAAAIDRGQGPSERSRQALSEEVRRAEEKKGASVRGKAPVRSARARAIAAVIGVVLVLLFFWLGSRNVTDGERRETIPARQEAAINKEPEAPLVLDIPTSMPEPEMIVYIVVKGDTLWAISKRFTGNPFNYPRVAKDNSIATPDLIFPGQRIKLVKKQ